MDARGNRQISTEMLRLRNGQFFGSTNQTVAFSGLTLTDTVYTHDRVDWHWHENAYFTLLLAGGLLETSERETFRCVPGTLLYHNSREPHYNVKPTAFARGFHAEISAEWLDSVGCPAPEGTRDVTDPRLRLSMYGVLKEMKLGGDVGSASIESLLVELLADMCRSREGSRERATPPWVRTVEEILRDPEAQSWSLARLAGALHIHPVHLSRSFSRYFGCTLGQYVRALRVQRGLALLTDPARSLTHIAFECGFADQSHFTRCFRALNGLNPSRYRSLLQA